MSRSPCSSSLRLHPRRRDWKPPTVSREPYPSFTPPMPLVEIPVTAAELGSRDHRARADSSASRPRRRIAASRSSISAVEYCASPIPRYPPQSRRLREQGLVVLAGGDRRARQRVQHRSGNIERPCAARCRCARSRRAALLPAVCGRRCAAPRPGAHPDRVLAEPRLAPERSQPQCAAASQCIARGTISAAAIVAN